MGSITILCRGCKRELSPEAFAVDRQRSTGRRYKCRSCSSAEFARWKQTPGYARRLEKELRRRADLKASDPKARWASMALSASKKRAKQLGLSHELTAEWVRKAADAEVCPLLEIPLRYGNTAPSADSAAIDRKDNTLGYTPDNCWVISMLANRVKTNATVEQVVTIARNLQRHLQPAVGNHPQPVVQGEPYPS